MFLNFTKGIPLNDLVNHREIIIQLTKRDIIGRYKGSVLGLLWSFLHPLVLVIVYTVVFGFVFKAKWGVELKQNFSILLFSGLIFHAYLSECLVRSPTLIINNINLVKKVVFPLEVLSWVLTFSSMFHFFASAIILFSAQYILSGHVYITWLYLPLLLFPITILCLGLGWLLSALSIFLRDITQVTTIISTILLFLCPIFYPMELVPSKFQLFLYLNPLTFIVEQSRQIIIYGNSPDIVGLFIYTCLIFVFTQISYIWFMKVRRYFADVL